MLVFRVCVRIGSVLCNYLAHSMDQHMAATITAQGKVEVEMTGSC